MSWVIWWKISIVFIYLMMLFSVVAVIGLLKPSWVIRWGKPEDRTRIKAFGIYAIIAVLFYGVEFMAHQESNNEFIIEQQANLQVKTAVASNPVVPPAIKSQAPSQVTSTAPVAKKIKLAIQDGWTWHSDDGDYTKINGKVKNVGDTNINYFEITAEYLDKAGNVLDSETINDVETIRPGNQKGFEIIKEKDSAYEKVRLSIEKVENR